MYGRIQQETSKQFEIMEYFWNNLKAQVGVAIPVAFGISIGLAYKSKPLQTVKSFYELIKYKKQANNLPLKMVIVVRGDVRMSTGKIGSQCAHAACVCFNQAMIKNYLMVREWKFQGSPKVVLHGGPGGESTLRSLHKSAVQKDIVASLIRDAGRTEVHQGTVTVLGIGPAPANMIDKITGHLKTL